MKNKPIGPPTRLLYEGKFPKETTCAKCLNSAEGFIRGYTQGFLRGQKFSEAIAQHPAEVCGAFFLLGTVVDRLFRFIG